MEKPVAAADGTDLLDYPEMVRHVDAVVEALHGFGCAPDERWDESRAVALYWTEGRDAWPYGLLVFWRMRDGWHSVPLDVHGDAAVYEAQPLPIDPVAASAAVTGVLLQLLGQSGPPSA
ncbi:MULTISPECIES: hypothetical protein [Streptomyces]|uniref:hypothetical protein n=1 Tax=Streptomyces TaxID=1883 RepID=UPI0004BD9E9D|nr:hypothetical protein [Streptomyces griseolus]MCW8215782.1 hypothetical protein [Streptomyces griseolus]